MKLYRDKDIKPNKLEKANTIGVNCIIKRNDS